MMRWLILTQMLWLLGCNDAPAPETAKEAWDTQAEVIFQREAVLRYELEQQKQKAEKRQAQGIETPSSSPRR
jgi:hypothetical protein